jgi:hypothetical protein
MEYQPYEKLKHKKEKKEKYKTVIPKQVELSNYKIYQFIIDSNDRNKSAYPNLNEFVIKATEPFKKVFAIRLLRSELNYLSTVLGRGGIYIYLNNYKLIFRNEQQDGLNLFARINPGVENNVCVTTNILDDPYTYILNPLDPKLQRFEVKLFDHQNKLFDDKNFTLVLQLAIFCYV